MFRVTTALVFALLLAACERESIRPDQPITPADLAENGILIVGLDSSLESSWGPWRFFSNELNAIMGSYFFMPFNLSRPSNGYVVMKVAPTADDIRFGPKIFRTRSPYYFKFCKGHMVPSVSIKAGEVIYAGNITANQAGKSLSLEYSYKFDSARQYISSHFPYLYRELKERRFEFYRVDSLPNCL